MSKQTPDTEGVQSEIPSPKTQNADTDTGDNVLRTAEEQMTGDITKLLNE